MPSYGFERVANLVDVKQALTETVNDLEESRELLLGIQGGRRIVADEASWGWTAIMVGAGYVFNRADSEGSTGGGALSGGLRGAGKGAIFGAIIDGGYDTNDINVNALPIYHCAQRDVFLNPTFYTGGTNILMAPDIGAILKTIDRYRANMFFAPPTVWIGLLRHPDFDKYDLSCLTKCYYGASIMPVEVLKELMERLPGCKVYNYYGQTELAPYHTILKAEDALAKLGSAGMAGLNMETRLEDADFKPIDAVGTPGEICGKGPHAMIMYFKDPEKTEAAMQGGWFHSGDIGELDDDRYITVVDRKKDMIKTGGENVSTREVEEAVYLDKRVEEVAVIGTPHPKWVEAVTAVVVPRQGETITEEEIVALCKKELAGFKVPKNVVFVEALPKTPTGKILKRDMRQTYADLSK